MVLEEMPLTANGKINRQGTPAPGGRGKGEGEERGPRTPVEEVVAGIWSEVLKREELVSVEASFFELGGHSLLGDAGDVAGAGGAGSGDRTGGLV